MEAGPGVSEIMEVKKKWCSCESDREGAEGYESAREGGRRLMGGDKRLRQWEEDENVK